MASCAATKSPAGILDVHDDPSRSSPDPAVVPVVELAR
jgi:hypothetical protein